MMGSFGILLDYKFFNKKTDLSINLNIIKSYLKDSVSLLQKRDITSVEKRVWRASKVLVGQTFLVPRDLDITYPSKVAWS